MEMVYDEEQGIFVPKSKDGRFCGGDGVEFLVCPGRGVPIKKLGDDLYGSASHEVFELGHYRRAIAAHSRDKEMLKDASSGAVMTHIACYLLDEGLIDGVTETHFVYGPPGPRSEVFVGRSREDILSAQGSKYCPTSTNSLIRECVESGGRYLFIGTPCQVGSLRMAIQEEPSLSDVFPFTMANFCGGYRDFHYLDEILSTCGLNPEEVESFRYRGGGQPGTLLAVTKAGKRVSIPYPDYVSISLIPKQKRCWYCVDATGELADFSCGDAWVDRLLKTPDAWSIILVRSVAAERILDEMIEKGLFETTSISEEEIISSQRSNLDSKKVRQYKRRKISRLFGIIMPDFDNDLPKQGSSYYHELRVLFGKTSVGFFLRRIKNQIRLLLRRNK
jgi:coenzyme F420 hydrogenase subunit beta